MRRSVERQERLAAALRENLRRRKKRTTKRGAAHASDDKANKKLERNCRVGDSPNPASKDD